MKLNKEEIITEFSEDLKNEILKALPAITIVYLSKILIVKYDDKYYLIKDPCEKINRKLETEFKVLKDSEIRRYHKGETLHEAFSNLINKIRESITPEEPYIIYETNRRKRK